MNLIPIQNIEDLRSKTNVKMIFREPGKSDADLGIFINAAESDRNDYFLVTFRGGPFPTIKLEIPATKLNTLYYDSKDIPVVAVPIVGEYQPGERIIPNVTPAPPTTTLPAPTTTLPANTQQLHQPLQQPAPQPQQQQPQPQQQQPQPQQQQPQPQPQPQQPQQQPLQASISSATQPVTAINDRSQAESKEQEEQEELEQPTTVIATAIKEQNDSVITPTNIDTSVQQPPSESIVADATIGQGTVGTQLLSPNQASPTLNLVEFQNRDEVNPQTTEEIRSRISKIENRINIQNTALTYVNDPRNQAQADAENRINTEIEKLKSEKQSLEQKLQQLSINVDATIAGGKKTRKYIHKRNTSYKKT